jgi:hypothetical protein
LPGIQSSRSSLRETASIDSVTLTARPRASQAGVPADQP